MQHTYQLHSGNRSVAVREAPTAHAALLDYARSLGCRDDEIMKLGVDKIAWRGAVFRAVVISPTDTAADR